MTVRTSLFPKARIPYGTWGTSYFPAWQMSPLAEVNIGQFAAESMNRILGIRKVPKDRLDYLITGSTIPWHWKFWNSPMLSSILGQRLPGFHVEQACATGLQAVVHAAAEVESGSKEFVGVLTFDRTSDSPVGVFPERRAHQRTFAISDVWDNFGFDPARPSPKRSSLLKTVHFRHLATTINTHFVFSAREIEGAFRLRSGYRKLDARSRRKRGPEIPS